MTYKLKKQVEINGKKYEIRNEYSVILSIFEAMSDPDLDGSERAFVLLNMFYPEFEEIPAENYQVAINQFFDFINGGKETKNGPKLIDWKQDFPYIVSAINRVIGFDIRNVNYDYDKNTGGVSWETFMSAFNEIGDCLFAQIVRIRDRKARGKSLDKSDREWYRQNRDLVDFKTRYSDAEERLLKEWSGQTT